MRYFAMFLLTMVSAVATAADTDPCFDTEVSVIHVNRLPDLAKWIANKRDRGVPLTDVAAELMGDQQCVLVPHGLLRADLLALAILIYEGDFAKLSGETIRLRLVAAYKELQK